LLQANRPKEIDLDTQFAQLKPMRQEKRLTQMAQTRRICDSLWKSAADRTCFIAVREMESWLRSVENNGNALREWRAQFPAIPVLHRTLYGRATFDREAFAEAYRRHVKEVQAYFADRPQDLLVMELCGGMDGKRSAPSWASLSPRWRSQS
jgi:hypothetical protein